MKPKFYPVIMVVYTEAGPKFKVARNGNEYDVFCSQFVGPDTKLEMIKPLYARYIEGNDQYIHHVVRHHPLVRKTSFAGNHTRL